MQIDIIIHVFVFIISKVMVRYIISWKHGGNFHRFKKLKKNAIPFFSHQYYVPNRNKQKITFNKHFARKYTRANTTRTVSHYFFRSVTLVSFAMPTHIPFAPCIVHSLSRVVYFPHLHVHNTPAMYRPIVQAVRVKIGRVCALLEEITMFCQDDQ